MDSSLELVCRRQQLQYQIGDGDFCVIAAGYYPAVSHRFNLTRRGREAIGVIIEFPVWKVDTVVEADEFCATITSAVLQPIATLYVDSPRRHFYVGGLTDEKMLSSYISTLAHDCDSIRPLCEAVGRSGWWSLPLLDLAFTSGRNICRYPQ